MDANASAARRVWNVIEPLHAVVYFDPQATDALKAAGIRGGWMAYFAGRFGPLGAIGPAAAAALAYGFAPPMVARALPDAWSCAAPERVTKLWVEGAAGALARHLSHVEEGVLDELIGLLRDAVVACRYEGRPLAAGWLDVARPDDRFAELWLLTTVLREHRGDGHVASAVAAGLRGIDAIQTHVATGTVTREVTQRNRGWTDEEWDESFQRLVLEGILGEDGGLTERGSTMRRSIEQETDRLAAGPLERLGSSRVEWLITLCEPLSRHVIDSKAVPVPNPIGVARP